MVDMNYGGVKSLRDQSECLIKPDINQNNLQRSVGPLTHKISYFSVTMNGLKHAD